MSDWTSAEHWAWAAIRQGTNPGNVADLALQDNVPRDIDPFTARDQRLVLSNRFLQDILTDPELQKQVTLHGVHLRHAIFRDDVDLAHLRLDHKLRFDRCRFEGEINMEDAEITSWLSFAGSVFANPEKELRLRGARLRELDLINVVSQSSITMDGVQVAGHVLLQHLRCPKTIDIVFARIEGSVDFSDAIVNEVNLSASQTGELRFGAVGAEDGQGQRQTRWLRRTSRLTLANTTASAWQDRGLEGAADPASPDPYLGPIELDYWPERLQLSGFSYQHLGGYSYVARRTPPTASAAPVEGARSMLTREVGYFVRLLQRDRSDTMQPYRQLTSVLRQAGYPEQGDQILYAGLEAERARAQGLRASWLWLLSWTIGYGVGGYAWRVLGWIAGLTALGTALLLLQLTGIVAGGCCPLDAPMTEENQALLNELREPLNAVVYSFHQLVPLFGLEPRYDAAVLPSCLRAYFYAHKIAGWLLGSVLVAAAAGLTQRRE